MRKKIFPLMILFSGLWSSQVGIGTVQPNTSSQLDIVSQNKGLLVPRVGLTSATDSSTISNGNVNSLLVFNTNTSSTGDVTPGYYYWYSNKWLRVANSDDLKNVADVQKIITVSNGSNTTVASAVTGNTTDYKVTVNPATTAVSGAVKAGSGLAVATDGTLSTVGPWRVANGTTVATDNTQNIYQAGKVAIGKAITTPLTGADATAALFVNGTITTVNSIYPDYVFEEYFTGFSELKKDYSFKSLKEIERFISQNKHLPGVTGIKNLNKNENGEYVFNLSELSVQVLEKVEELYLYVIEQQKQLELKDQTLEDLKKINKELLERIQNVEALVTGIKK